MRGDQDWLDHAIDEAEAAGCDAIAVVTEAPYYSRRERDLINQFRSRGSKSGTYAATQKVLRDRAGEDRSKPLTRRMEPARLTWRTIERIRDPLRPANHPEGHRDRARMRRSPSKPG